MWDEDPDFLDVLEEHDFEHEYDDDLSDFEHEPDEEEITEEDVFDEDGEDFEDDS